MNQAVDAYAENRISGLVETKASELDALITADYRFDQIRAEREAGRASPHDARLAAYALKKAYDTYCESMSAKSDLNSMAPARPESGFYLMYAPGLRAMKADDHFDYAFILPQLGRAG